MLKRRPVSLAFTLIELLVVIAMIALLVAILLPALARSRDLAYRTRELAASHHLMVAYLAYATDHDGYVLPGVLPADLVGGSPRAKYRVLDDRGQHMRGGAAQKYAWRIAPWLDYDLRALQIDKALYREFIQRDDTPNLISGRGSSYQEAFGTNTTFGINARLVGGYKERPFEPAGSFVRRMDQVRHPDKLLVFGSARGRDLSLDFHRIVRGFNIINPPRDVTFNSSKPTDYDQPETLWDDPSTLQQFGYVHYRHQLRAVIGHFDGHAEALRKKDLQDMRRWANEATGPDWAP